MDTVKKISVAVMQTRVPKRSANDSFELKATTMIVMMNKISCLSVLFFKSKKGKFHGVVVKCETLCI